MALNDKLINYEDISTFHNNLLNDSSISEKATWSSSKISSEILGIDSSLSVKADLSYVDSSLALKQDVLTEGNNISIEDGQISAVGYLYNSLAQAYIENPYTYQRNILEYILSVLGISELLLSGNANAVTYTYSGSGAVVFESMATVIISNMGGGLELDNGSYAYLNSIDTANQTVTFKSTLDADNALTNANVKAVVIPTDFYISGAANTTTYSYIDPVGIASSIESLLSYNMYMKFQGYPLVKVTAIDTNNETITFSETLDASSAISNLNYEYGRYDINQATGLNSHVEGADNESSGSAAHAEGRTTIASGDYGSHAEGHGTTASGNRSHAEGNHTTAQNDSEHAEGSFNVSHTGNALNEKTQHSIGIGEYVSASSTIYKNAFEVMQNGDIYVYGLGDYQGTDTHVQNASILSLQSYISSLEQRIYALEHPNT